MRDQGICHQGVQCNVAALPGGLLKTLGISIRLVGKRLEGSMLGRKERDPAQITRIAPKNVFRTFSVLTSFEQAKSLKNGAPGGIRIPDLCLRRAALYPAELRMQWKGA